MCCNHGTYNTGTMSYGNVIRIKKYLLTTQLRNSFCILLSWTTFMEWQI